MIQVQNLGFAFAETPIFTDLNFQVNAGEILTIIGPNGCGKSTLLRLLRGHLKSASGTIRWNGTPLSRLSSRELARLVAVVPQTTHIDFPYTVRELVTMGRYPHRHGLLGFHRPEDNRAVNHALGLADVIDLAERRATELSGGELQRVLLARALAQDTGTLFLDEATSHLDIDHRLELTELLLRLNREQGKTVVQISHDLDLAATISRRLLLLSAHGEMIALGPPDQVMTTANLQRLFHVDLRIDTNPYTGTPHITPLLNTLAGDLRHLSIHLLCGGGSGKALLRKLSLARAQLTVGPLNQGDSDHSLAVALDIPVITEAPFHPYSDKVLAQARQTAGQADIIVVAASCWGAGNLACLDLAVQEQQTGKPVYLIDPQPACDYTNGRAWEKITRLQTYGALSVRHEDQLIEHIKQRS